MTLEEEFNLNLDLWISHYENNRHFSNIKKLLDCKAYEDIVEMGKQALLFIRKNAERVPFHGLSFLVGEIMGSDFKIPEEIRGKVKDIRDYTIKWLDENMAKYI